MCIIIDANRAQNFFSDKTNSDNSPIWNWISKGNARIVVGGENYRELCIIYLAKKILLQLIAKGAAHKVSDASIASANEVLSHLAHHIKSDDQHILALARASNVRTLYTHDDNLIADFTNKNLINKPRGRVYKNVTHKHLLTHTRKCPRKGSV